MALRVARGLFRLWLVLSVLWIGGVGVVTWRTFPEEPWGLHDPVVEKVDPRLSRVRMNLIQTSFWLRLLLRNAAQPFGTPAF